jgi:hypothetical protein
MTESPIITTLQEAPQQMRRLLQWRRMGVPGGKAVLCLEPWAQLTLPDAKRRFAFSQGPSGFETRNSARNKNSAL